MAFDPSLNMIGGFSNNDGTIDFYLRVNSLIKDDGVVVDIGAGRAAWYEDDDCKTRRNIRLLKGRVAKMIAADIDPAVLNNRASDDQIIMHNGLLDLPTNSVDLIIADYVLEHIDNSKIFSEQIHRTLKSGGWFCARTPHKYCYISIISRVIRNINHSKLLKFAQPNRKDIDIFPTRYKLNTLVDVENNFLGWENKTFIFRINPAYFFGSKLIYNLQLIIHRLMPSFFSGNIYVYVRKP
jgi:SAM-dependent methyltransferase